MWGVHILHSWPKKIELSLHTEKQKVNFRRDALLCNKELELWDEGNRVPAVL